jgi:hypothetical protein
VVLTGAQPGAHARAVVRHASGVSSTASHSPETPPMAPSKPRYTHVHTRRKWRFSDWQELMVATSFARAARITMQLTQLRQRAGSSAGQAGSPGPAKADFQFGLVNCRSVSIGWGRRPWPAAANEFIGTPSREVGDTHRSLENLILLELRQGLKCQSSQGDVAQPLCAALSTKPPQLRGGMEGNTCV